MSSADPKFRTLFGALSVAERRHDRDMPSQSKLAPGSILAGELRGYYGEREFRPKSSRFGLTRRNEDGRARFHNGVDIYVPSRPFPFEIPVVAVCAGIVEFVYEGNSPDSLGNRVWLHAINSNGRRTGQRIDYGHLSRFAGHEGKVEAGTIIGYVGCSGNADTKGECRNAGALNINSGHVHLVWRDNGTPVDPLPRLGWDLRFVEIEEPIQLEEWRNQGHLLGQPDTGAGVEPGMIQINSYAPPAAGYLVAPFEQITLSDRAAIRSIRASMDLAVERLGSEKKTDIADWYRERAIDAFSKTKSILKEFKQRIDNNHNVLNGLIDPSFTRSNDWAARVHAQVAEALFLGVPFLWEACAGRALQVCASAFAKRRRDASGKWEVFGKDRWPSALARGGFALGGTSFVYALASGRVALHLSRTSPLEILLGQLRLCLSLGPGSSDHTALNVDRLEYLLSVEPGNDRLVLLVGHIKKLIQAQVDLSLRLARSQLSMDPEILASQVGPVQDDISAIREYTNGIIEAIPSSNEVCMRWLRAVAQAGQAEASHAEESLDAVRPMGRITCFNLVPFR